MDLVQETEMGYHFVFKSGEEHLQKMMIKGKGKSERERNRMDP